jgi:8-oxo-dGTP diphosphatase
VHPPESLPLAVAAVIRRADARYLLVRRAAGIPAAGYWTPPTGRPEPGETLGQALIREVREEVGLDVTAGAEVHRCPTFDRTWILLWLEATLLNEDAPIVLQAAEVAEARWVTAEEALALEPMFPATRTFFRERR